MVTISEYIRSLFRLTRFINLLIIAATMILVRYCLLRPLLEQVHMSLQLPEYLFVLLVIATVFTAAAGYVINDYFDRKIDRINKPRSVVLGKYIYPRHGMAWHLFFSITGALLGVFVSFRAHVLYLSLIFFMVSGLLWFYSTTYKRQLLLGNIIVSLLTAMVPFMVLLYELPLLAHVYGSDAKPIVRILMIWVLGFAVFAFLLNMAREIVKDAQDLDGDKIYGKQTVPVIWGLPAARAIIVSLLLFTIFLLILSWLRFVHDPYTLAYFAVLLVLPLLIVTAMILFNRSNAAFTPASLLLKFIMLAGLGYMLAVHLIMQKLS
jgi:4-hydroxybenzoate polyprenyltransferase